MALTPAVQPRMQYYSFLNVLCLVLVQIAPINAQVFSPNRTAQGLCSSLFSQGNATGEDSDTFKYGDFGANDLGQWKISVISKYQAHDIENAPANATEDSPNAVANVWLDPWGGMNLHNGGNAFSACAFVFKGLPQNTIRRGQDDDGTCHQTFSKACTDELTKRAANYAFWQVANPTYGPFSNLTPPILAPICNGIFRSLGSSNAASDFPAECRPFFDNGGVGWPIADLMLLTDNQTVSTNCTFDKISPGNNTSTLISQRAPSGITYTFNGTSPANAYDHMVDQVFPILTVIMPPANNTREAAIGNAIGYMSCIRARNTTVNSRVAPALPAATPVDFPSHLTKGDIAGIVIGSIAGAALLAGAAWWFWRRHQTRRTSATKLPDSGLDKAPTTNGAEAYQLSSKEKAVAQLDGDGLVEMGPDTKRGELEAAHVQAPQELAGSFPPATQKRAGV